MIWLGITKVIIITTITTSFWVVMKTVCEPFFNVTNYEWCPPDGGTEGSPQSLGITFPGPQMSIINNCWGMLVWIKVVNWMTDVLEQETNHQLSSFLVFSRVLVVVFITLVFFPEVVHFAPWWWFIPCMHFILNTQLSFMSEDGLENMIFPSFP